MSISSEIKYVATEELKLDPKNPRLREDQHGLSQPELLEAMTDWGLEEIGASVVESGFWAHEALLVVREKLAPKSKETSIIVVEGNRRLAAVRLLLAARAGQPSSPRWGKLASDLTGAAVEKLKKLPTIQAEDRSDIDSFLGFRHVTGIKQWEPHEKAAFIAKLVDGGLSYEDVMRRIGSKTPTVRQNYIALKLFRQLEELEEVAVEKVRNKFSVLFLSLRSSGTQGISGSTSTPSRRKRGSRCRPGTSRRRSCSRGGSSATTSTSCCSPTPGTPTVSGSSWRARRRRRTLSAPKTLGSRSHCGCRAATASR